MNVVYTNKHIAINVFRWNQVGLALPSRSYLAPAKAKLLARGAAQGTGRMHFSTDWRSRKKIKTGSATYRRVLNYVCTNPGSLDHKVSGPYHSTSLEVSELTRGVIINGVKWYPDSYGETDDYAFKVLHMYVVTVKDLEIGVFEVDKHIFCNCDHDDDIVPGVRKVRAVAGEVCLVLCESIRHLVTLYIDDRYPSVGTAVRVKDTTELEASDDVYVD